MKLIKRILIHLMTLMALVALLLATPRTAHAYADPGSGALLYQVAYTAFLAGTFYFRRFLNRVWGKRK